MRQIGIIGVGLLGSAVASRLLQKGFQVTGYDTRPEQVEVLRPQGLRAAADIAEAAAGADVVFTILPSLDSVESVVTGPGGLVETAPPEATVIQMSTISPELTRRLGEAAAAKGLGFLDTPISGTSAMVARGDCVILVAGDSQRTQACRPVFDSIARRTVHMGAVGMASLAKLVANLLVGLNTAVLAEALVFGAKGGLPPALLLDALSESAGASKMMEIRGPLMASHRFDPTMKVDLFLKDFILMLEEGRRLGAPLPFTALARQLCTAAAATGHGEQDLASVMEVFELLAGWTEARQTGGP